MILKCSECNKDINDRDDNFFEVHHWVFDHLHNRQLENEFFCSMECLKRFLQ